MNTANNRFASRPLSLDRDARSESSFHPVVATAAPKPTALEAPMPLPANASVQWRVVFDVDAFYLQLTNTISRKKPFWMYVSDPNKTEVFDVPGEYLQSLSSLGSQPGLISRNVRETRSVPLKFGSFSEARSHAVNVLGLPLGLEWSLPKKSSFWSFLSRS